MSRKKPKSIGIDLPAKELLFKEDGQAISGCRDGLMICKGITIKVVGKSMYISPILAIEGITTPRYSWVSIPMVDKQEFIELLNKSL